MTAIRKNCINIAVLACAALFAFPVPAASDDDSASLPVPRFVSLRSNDVNMRVGPGTRYSINWVYHREGLPVQVIEEYDQWRKIKDSDGTTGWVHKQMLQGKRTAVIVGKLAVLRRSPDDKSNPSLRAEAGVIGKLLTCEKDWCRMQIAGHKAWVKKANIYGAFRNEEF